MDLTDWPFIDDRYYYILSNDYNAQFVFDNRATILKQLIKTGKQKRKMRVVIEPSLPDEYCLIAWEFGIIGQYNFKPSTEFDA